MSIATKRIHVLGLGNVGCFFAHCLRQADRTTPISLLFHRESLFDEWDKAFQRISITTTSECISDSSYQTNCRSPLSSLSSSDSIMSSSSAYTIESISSTIPMTTKIHSFEQINDNEDPIYNLILATKSFKTLDALSSVKHRLSNQSTVLFAQNGLGTIPEINRVLFPDNLTRPSYLLAIVSHGLYSNKYFKSVHAGLGRVIFGHISESSPTSSALVDKILATSALNANYIDRVDLRNFQLEKLVANAVINPLTALFRCKNGRLFWIGLDRMPLRNLMKRLITEISQVFLQLDVAIGPVDPDRFSSSNMELMVTGIARKTRNNLSSMLQDVLNQRETEIDFINGWIVEEGEKNGIDVPCNKKIIELVKAREKLTEDQIESHFPGTITREEINSWTRAVKDLRHNGFKTSKKHKYNNHGVCIEAW